MVFEAIKNWLNRTVEEAETGDEIPVDHRLAVAAILVHIIAVDGVVTEDERARLRQCLAAHYGLSREETEKLITEATRRDENAVDLYGFTSVLKRELDEDGRREAIALMWEMVYADGEVSEFEDNVVWRVAELIGVSTRERVEIRQRIEARRGAA